MKITITAISRKEKISTKTGKPFTSLGIRTQEHGEKWLSGFGRKENAGWKVGDTVDVEIKEVQGRDGKTFLNFETPKDSGPAASSAGTAEIKNILYLKIFPMLVQMNGRLDLLLSKAGVEPEREYPKMTEKNDGSGFDDLGPIDENTFV